MPTETSLPTDHDARRERVRLALDGLSVGDAYGSQFFLPEHCRYTLEEEWFIPPAPWGYTDDTEMALGIAEVLDRLGFIEQDELAHTFGRRFRQDMYRGYGPGAVRLLSAVASGGDWRLESKALFGGSGSFGNGSAMRVAPVGAYFADDEFEVVAEQARLSSEVTHRHPEGQAGGIAIAVAAAYAWRWRANIVDPTVRRGMFVTVLEHTPNGELHERIEYASVLDPDELVSTAANRLGNGSRVSCQDTVPFCLWIIARHLNDYPAAVWNTVKAGGDVDTTAAIVGGVVALAVGPTGIPADWLGRREDLQFTV